MQKIVIYRFHQTASYPENSFPTLHSLPLRPLRRLCRTVEPQRRGWLFVSRNLGDVVSASIGYGRRTLLTICIRRSEMKLVSSTLLAVLSVAHISQTKEPKA